MGFQDRDYSKDHNTPPDYVRIPQLSSMIWLIIICSIFSLIDLDKNLSSMSNVTFNAIFKEYHFWAIAFSPVTPSFFGGWFSLVLVLYFFGNRLVEFYGFKEFLTFYYVLALIGMVTYWLVKAIFNTNDPHLIEPWDWSMMGILMISTLYSPNENVRLYFLLPIKLKYLFGFIVLFKVAFMLSYSAPIVEFISLGAVMGFTFLYAHYKLRLTDLLATLRRANMKIIPGGLSKKSNISEMSEADIKREVDRILDKITENGPGSLSSKEKEFLKLSSQKFKK